MMPPAIAILLAVGCDGSVSPIDATEVDPEIDTGVATEPPPADPPSDSTTDTGFDGPLPVSALTGGELAISEIMFDPAGPRDDDGEWFELYNASAHPIDLYGLEVRDGSHDDVDFVVDVVLVVDPGAYALFGRNGDPALNGGLTLDFDYESTLATTAMGLNNAGDALIISYTGTVLDEVVYDEGTLWPAQSGVSLNLHVDFMDPEDNDLPAFWCASTSLYATTPIDKEVMQDFGTPGMPNEPCLDPIDDDGDGFAESEGDCDDGDSSIYEGAPEVIDDGIDQDCDGEDTTVLLLSEAAAGDLVITEIMANPKATSDNEGEWVEVYNATPYTMLLDDLVLGDRSQEEAVDREFTLESGGIGLLCRDDDSAVNGGLANCDADYDSVKFGNDGDIATISSNGRVLDTVDFQGGDFAEPTGASLALSNDAFDVIANDDGQSWCVAQTVYVTTYNDDGSVNHEDEGTPGVANDCP